MKFSKTVLLSTAALGLGLSLNAHAADWTVNTSCNAVASCTLAYNAHTDLRLRGYAGATSGSAAWGGRNLAVYGTNHLGVIGNGETTGSGSPQHAADNNGSKEAVLLDFFEGSTSQKMALQSLTLGWWSRDYDISVLYYDAPATTTTNVMSGWGVNSNNTLYSGSGSTWGNWKVLGNYSAAGNSGSPEVANSLAGSDCSGTGTNSCTKVIDLVNTGNVTSSHWLVMAYSSAVGGNKVGNNTLSVGNDFFKLMSFTGKTVSEPGALAIAALGLFGLGLARRRRA